MSREKPKSALAAFLAQNVQAASIDAQVGIPERTALTEKNIQAPAANHEYSLVNLNPEDCSPWEYYDRPENEFGDLEGLAESMKTHGQQEPVLVRPAKEPNKYEIIFGNRRWRAAKLAEISLSAIVKPLTDQQAALCQKEENENRRDLSDYARAMSYRRLIEKGVFASENELSKTLGISRKTLNDIMAYLRIPDSLRNQMTNLSEISRNFAVKLSVLAKDPKNLELLIKNIRKINEKKIHSGNIESFLHSKESQILEVSDLITVQNKKGRGVIFLKSAFNGNLTIKVDREIAGKLSLDTIKEHMEALLNHVPD